MAGNSDLLSVRVVNTTKKLAGVLLNVIHPDLQENDAHLLSPK